MFTVPATDDDVLNKTNALISKAVRTLGLRLVPGDLVDEALNNVRQTMATRDARDPDAAKKQILDSFGSLGIPVDSLKDYLGHGLETIAPSELQELRSTYMALRDGETTWKAVMDAREDSRKSELKSKVDEAKKSVSKPETKAKATEQPEMTEDQELFG